MTGKQLKIKLIELDISQKTLAKLLCVTVKTVNTICNKPNIPVLYRWAITAIETEFKT
jgi:plasmid maintenance system antidote protein VapI